MMKYSIRDNISEYNGRRLIFWNYQSYHMVSAKQNWPMQFWFEVNKFYVYAVISL